MQKYILLISFLAYSIAPAQSQLKKADKLFASKAYTNAAEMYGAVITDHKGKLNTTTLLNAADANYYINDVREALALYEKAYKMENGLEAPYIYRYYQCLRGVRDYEKSDEILMLYLKQHKKMDLYQGYRTQKDTFYQLLNDTLPSRFATTNLAMNTEYSEFAPVIYKDRVIFSSSRPGASKEVYTWNEQPFLSMFIAEKMNDGELTDIKVFSKQVSSDFHDATLAVSDQSDWVFFSTSYVEKNKLVLDTDRTNHFELYQGRLEDSKIVDKEPLFFNSKEYSVGHPALGPNGKYLFFASDMPGGYGAADLYYCRIYEDGVISTPKNLGPQINTWGNDFFPYVHDGVLYFASDGHIGFGGLDLYESEISKDMEFSEPKNLGKVVNSSFDDFAITFNKDGLSGYLSSNRITGKGDDDIYFFTRKPLTCDQIVYGNVKDRKDLKNLMGAKIVVKDSLGEVYQTVLADSTGYFETKLPCHFKATLLASHKSYFEKSKEIKTGMVDQERMGPIDFFLENAEDRITKDEKGVEKIVMDPIYFGYDKWDITPNAALVLDKAVELMEFYPNMIIKIEAHTDSRGSASYNLSLSDKRAKATRDYLYSKGIATNRIESANGFGESRLLNHCSDGVQCSENQHDVNRRSDFIILKR